MLVRARDACVRRQHRDDRQSERRDALVGVRPGSVVVGLEASAEHRGHLSSVAVRCRDALNVVSTAPAIVAPGASQNPLGQSTCAPGETADGIYGRSGDVVDAIGIACPTDDGFLVGGGGGSPVGPLNCPAGERLVGLEGTVVNYFGGNVISSLTGVCSATPGGQCSGSPTDPSTLVGCWAFDEPLGSTTANDSSAFDNDGTYLGNPLLGVPGVRNTAVSMDGVDDLVRVPDDDSLDVEDSFTLEGPIRRQSTDKTQQSRCSSRVVFS